MLLGFSIALRIAFFVFFALLLGAPALGEVCQPQGVVVEADKREHVSRVCNAVAAAEKLLEKCDLPQIPSGLRIEVVDSIEPECMALYDCDGNEISILSLQAMEALRSPGAFSYLEIGSYFASVVVHEVTHSAFAGLPCPFDSCVVAQEYAAYALQVMSLDAVEREEFLRRSDVSGRVSSDELSAIILFMAPDRFARKVWTHLRQREDACAYLQGIADGRVLLDRGRF